jgi:hypothetical protein
MKQKQDWEGTSNLKWFCFSLSFVILCSYGRYTRKSFYKYVSIHQKSIKFLHFKMEDYRQNLVMRMVPN